MGTKVTINPKKILSLIGIGVLAIIFLSLSSNLFETNNIRTFQVKQAFVTGSMSVRNDAGTYWQGFGDITTYDKHGMFHFSRDALDGGEDESSQPLGVTFMGNSTAKISGVLKYQLPSGEKKRLTLHELYGGTNAIKMELIRNQVAGALKQTGPLFRPEEAFITRRAEFTETVLAMLRNGLYATESQEVEVEREDEKMIKEMITKIKLDSTGQPIIAEPSTIQKHGIIIADFVIKDIDFDQLTDNLIKKKKEAEQMQVVARANAEKAKQDAITAEQQGLANIAQAKAEEEVQKIREVTQAQKEFEVTALQAKKAKEEAKKIEAIGRAEALAAKAKVAAGLTPLEKAQIEKETAIGVAAEIAKVKFPDNMVIVGGGGKSGGQINPFDAVGLQSLHELSKDMAKGNK